MFDQPIVRSNSSINKHTNYYLVILHFLFEILSSICFMCNLLFDVLLLLQSADPWKPFPLTFPLMKLSVTLHLWVCVQWSSMWNSIKTAIISGHSIRLCYVMLCYPVQHYNVLLSIISFNNGFISFSFIWLTFYYICFAFADNNR